MKVREIAIEIVKVHGGSEDQERVRLSRVTRYLKDANKITSYNISGSRKDTYWGSPKWLNEDNSIKEEFMFITTEHNKKSSIDDIEL